jgi:hypothetical protein
MNSHYQIGKQHLGCSTTLAVVIGNAKLRPKFLLAKTPLDPLSKIVVDLLSSPPLITFVLGATTCFHSCGYYDNIM